MCKQFLSYNCNMCSIAPPTDYTDNKILQKLLTEEEYFSRAEVKFYIDIRDSKSYIVKIEKLRKGKNK